jgi:copper(I)-binding protein
MRCLLVALGLAAATAAAAHGHGKGDLAIRHPWTRATVPGAKVAAGYLEIRNSGAAVERLLGASSPAAAAVELHVTSRDGAVVKMRERETLEIPARERLTLRPGGAHLMLTGLKQPFVKGERVPVKLLFERTGELQIELEVQAADSRKPHH